MDRHGDGIVKALVKVKNLKKYFPLPTSIPFVRKKYVLAVDGVDFEIHEGETLGVAGESGCGKTTLGRTILFLERPTDGRVLFHDANVFTMNAARLKAFRQNAQIVFQNPFTSLNPRMKVREIVGDSLRIHGLAEKSEIEKRVIDMLTRVRLSPENIDRFPHEFSGGQRQRIAIARALILNPDFVVLDEPTSSLDVSVQAHILNDLKLLQRRMHLTYLFISHNLSVIKHMSHRIAIMYLGKLVELAETQTLFQSPLHPYTRALFSGIPIPDPRIRAKRILLHGDVPSPVDPPAGCRFHPRCAHRREICEKEEPKLVQVDSDHFVACHR